MQQKNTKVVNVSTSKTGKHGHAKANFTATDIFTGKKLEDVIPSTHTTSVPVVSRNEYQLLDISDDGFCSLLTGKLFIQLYLGAERGEENVSNNTDVCAGRCRAFLLSENTAGKDAGLRRRSEAESPPATRRATTGRMLCSCGA